MDGANGEENPWVDQADPWSQYPETGPPQTPDQSASAADVGQPGASAGTYTQMAPQTDAQQPYKVINDVPPSWDGKDPDNQIEPYLKMLHMWLNTTRTLKTQRGMTLLTYSQGDLKLLINELDIETLTSENSGQVVYEYVKTNYLEYLDKKMPKAIERLLFDPASKRQRNESMLQYISRKRTLLGELDRCKCVLPDNAKGYIMLRDAQLPEKPGIL